MPNRPPPSYDDIVRRTVPEPDSSWRPSKDQEHEARQGFQALDEGEAELFARVHEALRASGFDTGQVGIEIDGDRVILRGTVRDAQTLRKLPDLVRQVDGVADVADHLVIAAASP
jgi:hypothetical protein